VYVIIIFCQVDQKFCQNLRYLRQNKDGSFAEGQNLENSRDKEKYN